MRVRATRASATGCNARKRALTIGQLLPSGLGRVAAIYTDPERPSWDEVIAQNRKALGPERVPESAYISSTGWQLSPGIAIAGGRAVATAAAQFGIAGYYQTVVPGQTYFVTTIVDSVAAGSVRPVLLGGSQVSGTTRTAPGVYFELLQAVAGNDRFAVQFNGAGSNTATARVFAQEITDWAQCVLFDDANGTVPIFSPLQSARGRGLLLDRSQGLVRGVELVVNGGFDTGTGWTGGTGWGITAGVATKSAGTQSDLSRLVMVDNAPGRTAGKTFEISFTAQVTAGGFTVSVGGHQFSPTDTTSGAKRFFLLASDPNSNGSLYIRGNATFAGTIDNISVRELPGNHMSQPTAAARGEFSARYNRLTNTGFLLGAVGAVPTDWIERGNVTGRVIEDVTAPSGRAMRVTVSVGGGIAASSDVRCPSSGLVSGAATRIRLLAKRVSGSTIAGWAAALSSGSLNLTDQYAWHTLNFNASSESNGVFLGATNPMVYDVAAIDMRPVVDFIPSIPDFQRVNSAADYDDVGFPAFHRQQTDDWGKTRINPNGATKMFALAAVQKMTEVGTAILIESSPITDTNAGSFRLVAPALGGGQEVAFASRGAGLSDGVAAVCFFSGATAFDAPARLATTGEADIPNRVSRLTVNGAAASSNLDQGTGPYLVHDVHFGSRGGTSLFENTRQFAPPLILFCQPADTINPSHVARLQRAYAKAAGVTI